MKMTFKGWVAVAALAAAGLAQAQDQIDFPPRLLTGTGSLTLSDNALAVLAVSGTSLRTPINIPALPVPGAGTPNPASYTRNTGHLNLAFNSLTTTDSVGAVTALHSANSFIDFRRVVVQDDDTLIRYSVYLSGFDLDLRTSTIYANLISQTVSLTGNAVINLGRQAVFTATLPGIVGGTQGNVVYDGPDSLGQGLYHASGSLAGYLRMNTNTANLMLSALGLSTGDDPVPTLWRDANWGTATFLASSVPEPATYALFGMGLLIAGAMARRRQA